MANTDTPTPPKNPLKPIAVRLWEELQELLGHEKSPYLDRDKFVLQKDAYMRLADEEIEFDVPFLIYEHNEPTHDEALEFSFYFFQYGFSINIGPTAFEAPYASYAFGATEVQQLDELALRRADVKPIAKNILLTIKYLLNGQIALGCTFKNGHLLAVETFMYGVEDQPFPVAVAGNYTLTQRSGPDYLVKRNKLLSGHLGVADDFPLLPPIVEGTRVRRGRTTDDIYDLEPLTKKQFDRLEAEINLSEFAGKPADKKPWTYIYGTVYFWFVSFVVIGLVATLKYAPGMPTFLANDWLQPIYVIGAWYVISWVTGWLLGYRQVKINAGANPLSARIERTLGRIFGKR